MPSGLVKWLKSEVQSSNLGAAKKKKKGNSRYRKGNCRYRKLL
jgi:hypothetical protein